MFRIRTSCLDCGLKWYFDRADAAQAQAAAAGASCARCGGPLEPIELSEHADADRGNR